MMIRKETLRGLMPEDLLKFSWLEEMALSPDGRRVAYTVRRPDAGSNGYRVNVYLQDIDSGTQLKLNRGDGQGSSLAWSRDGSRLAYVWAGDDGTRIEVTAADGESERTNPVAGAAPAGLDWSPDGKQLAYWRWTPVRNESESNSRPGVPAPTIRVITRLGYRFNGPGWIEDRYQHIWALDLETGEEAQLTDGECDYNQPVWSWSGNQLAFVGAARERDTYLGHGQVFVLEAASGEIELVYPNWDGAAVSPQWRADDRAIAFAGFRDKPPFNTRRFYHVWEYDLDRGEARELTGDLDNTVGNYAVADQRAGLSNITVRWPGGAGPIYFLLTEKGATHLYSVTEAGEWRHEVGGKEVTFEYSPSPGGRVVYGQASPTSIGELYVLEERRSRQLTQLNPWLKSRVLSAPEEYWYKGLEGTPVQAWEIKPVGYEEGKRYPTIVYVHCSMFSWDFNHEFQCLANEGYVVAYFNQRGTTAGYGQAWTFASKGDQGGAEYEEVMLGVDDLITRPYVDVERLGVTGGSCGGFLTNWIVGHTDRFAAAVTQRSVVNEVSQFGTSDIGPECTEGETGANPWTDFDAVWQQSPLAYVENVHTPLLIIHSDEDYRCPLEQAEQLFAALRWLGREVEMVIFKGENHGLSRGGRPGNRIERQRRILGWFVKYLGNKPS